MCGICGYIHLDSSKRPSEAVLKEMMATLSHRGPDDEGVYLKDNVALGHRRLSIIDLKTGHQPLTNEDGSLVIIYNGEVYNFKEIKEALVKRGHRFSTQSDTEAVIHAYEEYGEDCLKMFNGMFAFAIWDSRKERLFLARDRFGKKPLYYAVFDNQFIFGSELKSVLKHPSVKKEIDPAALSKYLAYEYVPAPYSIFRGIYKLEAGTRLVFDKGLSPRTERFWDVPLGPAAEIGVEEAKSELIRLFEESVRKRLISDVPLGVFLSGGMDSSTVVAMMARIMNPKEIKTFSIGFSEGRFDELRDGRRIADYFGTDHREEVMKASSMEKILPNVVGMMDEPFADSSILPTYLLAEFTRKFVTVALGGDGGDELFLGYPSFLAYRVDDCLGVFPPAIKRALVGCLTSLAPHSERHMNLFSYGRRFSRGLNLPEEVRHQAWIGSFIPEEQRKLFLHRKELDFAPHTTYNISARFFRAAANSDALTKAEYIHIKTYLTDDVLVKVDRASMAHSLEVRAPFLDKDFAEFALRLPANLKMKGFTRKWILKEAFKGLLPRQTLNKPKKGFAVPVAKWLKEDMKSLLLNTLSRKKIEREDLFDYDYIKEMLWSYEAGARDVGRQIWALFMFELWYDRWVG